MKCDACEKDFPRGNIGKFRRKELRKKFELPTGLFGKIKIKENWKKPEYQNIEKNNPGFKRLARLCKVCQ